MKRSTLAPTLAITLAALSGCAGLSALLSPPPVAAGSPTPTAAPAATATPTAEPGATPTPTPGPSATPKPTLTTMYVMNGLGKTIDAVNLKTGVVTKSVLTTGLYPNQLWADGSTGYLVNSGDANLIKFDLVARSQSGKLDLPVGANPMSVTPTGGGKGVVANYLAKTVTFVNLSSMQAENSVTLSQGQPSGGVAVANGKVYIAASTADYSNYPAISYSFSGIHVVNVGGTQVAKTITLANDANPFSVVKDPSGLIQVGFSGGVLTIDPSTDEVLRTIPFTKSVSAIDFLNADTAYGAADGNGLVSFNPKTGAVLRAVTAKIVAGDTSVGAFRIRGNLAYVPNFASDSVTVVDLTSGTATGSPYQVGDGPQELTFVTTEE